MEMILLKYQLQFTVSEKDKDTLNNTSAEKEEAKLRKELETYGDVVDILLDDFPKQFIVTFGSSDSTTSLLNASNIDY